eukprot:g19518.t1
MKLICRKVGAPTPPFTVLSGQDFVANVADEGAKRKLIQDFTKLVLDMNSAKPGLVKSIHGGGGKGSAQVGNPRSPEQVQAAVSQVLNEMKRADGLYMNQSRHAEWPLALNLLATLSMGTWPLAFYFFYLKINFEEKVNNDGDGRFFQLELELDGTTVANGGRFVWFNKRLQKVVEIGLTDQYLKDLSMEMDQVVGPAILSDAHDSGYGEDLPYFIPWTLYSKARKWAADIAADAGNNTRATLEALVENEALALLERDSSNNRRYTFAELLMRAKGYSGENLRREEEKLSCANIFQPTRMRNVACHARWLHGDPDENGMITYKPGEVVSMQGPQFAFVRSELMPAGEISFTSDPQLGKVVMLAENWHKMCFANPEFQSGRIASNETFSAIEIPNDSRVSCSSTVRSMLEGPVTDVLVNGYRFGV